MFHNQQRIFTARHTYFIDMYLRMNNQFNNNDQYNAILSSPPLHPLSASQSLQCWRHCWDSWPQRTGGPVMVGNLDPGSSLLRNILGLALLPLILDAWAAGRIPCSQVQNIIHGLRQRTAQRFWKIVAETAPYQGSQTHGEEGSLLAVGDAGQVVNHDGGQDLPNAWPGCEKSKSRRAQWCWIDGVCRGRWEYWQTLWKLAMKTKTCLVMVLMPLMLIPKYMTVVKERKVRRLVLLPV